MIAKRVLVVTLALAFARPLVCASEEQPKVPAPEQTSDQAQVAEVQPQVAPTEQTIAQAQEQGDGEVDETKQILAQLTWSMASEVIDSRHFIIRESKGRGKKIIRLGNTASVERGSLDETAHQEKLKAGADLLSTLVARQMVRWKAAPEDQQPAAPQDGSDIIVVADVWTMEGRHINGVLKKEGHVLATEDYQSELGKDILTAAAKESRKEQYKKLEEAVKENEDNKKQQLEEAQKQRQEEALSHSEPFGVAGVLGLAIIGVLVLGVATNFGRGSNKKMNLNRKRGPCERMWAKLKGE